MEENQEKKVEEVSPEDTLSNLMKNKSGLKINNKKSTFQQPKVEKIDFRQKINEILTKEEEQKKISFQLNSQYQQLLKSKLLDSEKTLEIREEEKQIVKDLIDFSRIINSDENQDEDIGTVSLFIMLLRSLLVQRDRINELEFAHNKTLKELEVVKTLLKSKVEL